MDIITAMTSLRPRLRPAGCGRLVLGMKLIRISPGEFLMGSPENEPGRVHTEYQHRVMLTREFLMGATTVSQSQWLAVMRRNPSWFKGDNLPVTCVSWYDAVEFCNLLSDREGLGRAYTVSGWRVTWDRSAPGYRLPTEAEWEYSCRAGTTTPFSFGLDIGPEQVNYGGRWTVPVGSLPANPWGLHEMHGNVWEWCWDTDDEQYGLCDRVEVDPVGGKRGSFRVIRGGDWQWQKKFCRSASRGSLCVTDRCKHTGLRIVRSVVS